MAWAAQNMQGVGGTSQARGAGRGGTGGPRKPTPVPPLSPGEAQPRKLHPIPIPPARCYTYSWDQDNFGESGAFAEFLARPSSFGEVEGSPCAELVSPSSPFLEEPCLLLGGLRVPSLLAPASGSRALAQALQ